MLARLKNDFHLAMLTLVGAIIVLCVTPYGVYRLFTGSYIVGVADMLMVLSAIFATRMAWRTGDTVKQGLFLALVFCAGAFLVCIKLGSDGLFWVYPFLVFVFFLVSPIRAFLLLLLMLLGLFLIGSVLPDIIFAGTFQMMAFFVTTTITSIFSFIFAYRAQVQRRELERLATTDSLTGALNRRTLNDQLAIAIDEFAKTGRYCGLILLDLDHFKQVNDKHGHKVGDKTLTELVQVLQAMMRLKEQVFRFGGEEFVVLIANIAPADFERFAEKLRVGVERNIVLPDGVHITTSIGAAMLHANEDWEAWLHRADMALYQAKHQGRNQVVMA